MLVPDPDHVLAITVVSLSIVTDGGKKKGQEIESLIPVIVLLAYSSLVLVQATLSPLPSDVWVPIQLVNTSIKKSIDFSCRFHFPSEFEICL